MLEYIFFDLYGTLIDIEIDEAAPGTTEMFRQWVEQTYGDAAAARERSRPLVEEIRGVSSPARPHGEPDLAPVLHRHLQGLLDHEPDEEDVRAAAGAFRYASHRRFALSPGVDIALARLGPHVRLGLISNAQWLFTCPELEQLSLTSLFDPIVISSQVGVRKPSREIFESALYRAQVRPHDSLYVGNDLYADIEGAAAIGMHTCLVGTDAWHPTATAEPELRVDSVAELPALLLETSNPLPRTIPARMR